MAKISKTLLTLSLGIILLWTTASVSRESATVETSSAQPTASASASNVSIDGFERITSEALASYLEEIQRETQKFQLSNGIRVIFVQNGVAPTVALYIKFLVGAFNETPEEYGIAHMLEHMLFKGTKRIGTLDFLREKKYIDLMHSLSAQVDRWEAKKRELLALLGSDSSIDDSSISDGSIDDSSIADGSISDNSIDDSSQSAAAQKKTWQHISGRVEDTKILLGILQKQHAWYVRNGEDAVLYQLFGGIRYNAYTSSDLTNYQLDLPTERLALWATLEADRIQNAVQRNFYTERKVVREERSLRLDNRPRYLLLERLKKEIYGDFPYAHSIIGSPEDIAQMNHLRSKHFYEKHYRPEKMVITVAGNFDVEKTREIIEKHFGGIGEAIDNTESIENEKVQTTPELLPLLTDQEISDRIAKLHLRREKDQGGKDVQDGKSGKGGKVQYPIIMPSSGPPIIYLAWLKPPYSKAGTSDIDLDVLAEILANSPESRLVQRLIHTEKIASSVSISAQYPGFRDVNVFLIQIIPILENMGKENNTEQAESASVIFAKIRDLVQEEIERSVTKEELAIARARMRMDLLSFQTNAQKAELLSSYESLGNDYKELFHYYQRLDQVSPRSITNSIRSFLQPEHRYSAYLKVKQQEQPARSGEGQFPSTGHKYPRYTGHKHEQKK